MAGIEFEPVTYPDSASAGELRAPLAHYQGLLANVANDLRTEAEEGDATRQLHALTGLTGFLRLHQHYANRAEGMVRYQEALVGEIKRLEILLDRSSN